MQGMGAQPAPGMAIFRAKNTNICYIILGEDNASKREQHIGPLLVSIKHIRPSSRLGIDMKRRVTEVRHRG